MYGQVDSVYKTLPATTGVQQEKVHFLILWKPQCRLKEWQAWNSPLSLGDWKGGFSASQN